MSLSRRIQLARPVAEHVLTTVASFYKIPMREMKRERGRAGGQTFFVARAHMLATFLLRQRTRLSFPVIGGAVGRDHSTIQYAVDQIALAWATDAKLQADVAELSRRLDAVT